MDKIFVAVLAIALFTVMGCDKKERYLPPANEQPMYGGQAVPPADLAADSKADDIMIRQTGSKEAAVKKMIEEAAASYQRGYFEIATHRLNQAWLLDPKNEDILNLFAQIMAAEGKHDEAVRLYQQSLSANPRDARTLCRAAREYQNKAVDLLTGGAGADSEAGARENMEKALGLYEQASHEAKTEDDLSDTYYQWAIALAVNKDLKGAWDKVHRAQKHGGRSVEKAFLERLSKDMPEPRETPDAS